MQSSYGEEYIDSYRWVSVPDNQIPVVVQTSGSVDNSLAEIVKRQLDSEEYIVVYGIKYYYGWNKVIDDVSNFTGINSPNLKVVDSVKNSNAIILTLTDKKSHDGYSGYTKLDIRDSKVYGATITIYEAGTQSRQALDALVRHELGHALGLGHLDTEDALMTHVGIKSGMISMFDVIGYMLALLEDK